jgi:hypothetical protein
VPVVLILRECQSEVEALAQEMILIALFRQAGFNLTNLTDGGEKGHFSDESRQKMKNSHIGVKLSPERAEKNRIARLGRKNSLEAIAKTRAAHIGIKHSLKAREKIRMAAVGRVMSLETRAKMSASAKIRRMKERQVKMEKNDEVVG